VGTLLYCAAEDRRHSASKFTLDDDCSALSRIKRDLLNVIDTLRKESSEFQQRVVAELEGMKVRRKESFASPRHGRDFEHAAYGFIPESCQTMADVAEHTGDRVGQIKHCKTGDCVIILGPDCGAAGARIVCEIKEDASYDLRRSLDELNNARTNRSADVGLFVHSKRTAPAGLKPLARYGNDVVIVWDSEDNFRMSICPRQ
jgi:hypothetical protein